MRIFLMAVGFVVGVVSATHAQGIPRSAESLECSAQADTKGLHGAERAEFMRQCKASAAAAPSAVATTPQQEKMKECSAKWQQYKAANNIEGKEAFQMFLSGCLKSASDQPVAKPAAAAPSSAMRECSQKYVAARDSGTLNGRTWNDFRAAECSTAGAAVAGTSTIPQSVPARAVQQQLTQNTLSSAPVSAVPWDQSNIEKEMRAAVPPNSKCSREADGSKCQFSLNQIQIDSVFNPQSNQLIASVGYGEAPGYATERSRFIGFVSKVAGFPEAVVTKCFADALAKPYLGDRVYGDQVTWQEITNQQRILKCGGNVYQGREHFVKIIVVPNNRF